MGYKLSLLCPIFFALLSCQFAQMSFAFTIYNHLMYKGEGKELFVSLHILGLNKVYTFCNHYIKGEIESPLILLSFFSNISFFVSSSFILGPNLLTFGSCLFITGPKPSCL